MASGVIHESALRRPLVDELVHREGTARRGLNYRASNVAHRHAAAIADALRHHTGRPFGEVGALQADGDTEREGQNSAGGEESASCAHQAGPSPADRGRAGSRGQSEHEPGRSEHTRRTLLRHGGHHDDVGEDDDRYNREQRAPKIASGNRMSSGGQSGTDARSRRGSQHSATTLQGKAHCTASGIECTPSPTAA